MVEKWCYMPILKWKRAEQHALKNLTEDQFIGITPLIELQPIDAAPDIASVKTALPGYLRKVAEQIINSIPDSYAICLDTSYLSVAYARQVNLLITVCKILQQNVKNRRIIPVVHGSTIESLNDPLSAEVEYLKEQEALILRLRTDQIRALQVEQMISDLAGSGIKKRFLHLLIDQFSLVDNQPSDCCKTIKPYLDYAMAAKCASITLAGGSFPMFLTGLKQGLTDIPRIEWNVWKVIQKSAAYQELRYADYTVTNPTPLPDVETSGWNPSIAIRYAHKEIWRLYKGRGFKSKAPGEYRNLCKILTTDSFFSGESFSYGDAQYKRNASGDEKNRLPWLWRRDATNHHIVYIASLL